MKERTRWPLIFVVLASLTRIAFGTEPLPVAKPEAVGMSSQRLEIGKLDNARILARKTVEYMTADHLGPEVNIDRLREYPNINGYGLGLGVAVRHGYGVAGLMGSPGDFNWGGAYGTCFWVDPKEEMAVVFMAATPGALRLHNRQLITSLVLQAIAD